MSEPGAGVGGNPGGGPTGGGGSGAGGGGGGGRDHRHHDGRRGGDDDHHRRRHHHRYRHDGTRIYEDTSNQTASAQTVNVQDECDRGYDDGLKTGAKDARRGQSSDPYRSDHYKKGGGGFFSWGRSAAAKQAYRDCFLKGYEEGYRNPNLYFGDPGNN